VNHYGLALQYNTEAFQLVDREIVSVAVHGMIRHLSVPLRGSSFSFSERRSLNNGSRHRSPGGGSFSCRVIFRLAFVPDAAPWYSGTPAWHTCRGFTMLRALSASAKLMLGSMILEIILLKGSLTKIRSFTWQSLQERRSCVGSTLKRTSENCAKARTPVVKIAKMTKRTVGSLRQKALKLGLRLGHQR
jgi:hypothetical protein